MEEENKTYTITYHHDYAVVTVVAEGKDEDEAIFDGVNMIKSYYGWDISRFKIGEIEEQ
jgi:hypothetical protein